MARCLHGTGMYMTTECMPMYSLHIPTACGGTGDGRQVSMARVGDSALAGTLHGIHHGTRLGITEDGILHGMQAIGAATGEPDGIITIIILIMDGAVDGIVQGIQTIDQADISHIIEEIQ